MLTCLRRTRARTRIREDALGLALCLLAAAAPPTAGGARVLLETALHDHGAGSSAHGVFWGSGGLLPPLPGQRCTGSLFASGDCGTPEVSGPDGGLHAGTARCFGTDPHNPGALAEWGEYGVCHVPEGGDCDSDEQCRTWTSCTPAGGGRFTCQEEEPAYSSDEEDPAAAEEVASTVRSMASRLLNSSVMEGDDSLRFVDPVSGAFSPYTARPELAKQVLPAVEASFASARLKNEGESSRSGALFFSSGDGLFLAKTVRLEEFQELSQWLIGTLVDHIDLKHATCPVVDSGAACWANATLVGTLLNVPVLAFADRGHHWIVMPSAAGLRQRARPPAAAAPAAKGGLSPGDAGPSWGQASYYDVKPFWARSRERAQFMRLISELGINPTEPDAPEEMSAQWQRLHQVAARDLDFLATHGSSDGKALIDYSLLFEVYRPGRDVDVAGSACIKAASCFHGNVSACSVVCVSIIDYFTRYSTLRALESMLKSWKFHDYAEKTEQLLTCALAQPKNRMGAGLALVSAPGGDPELSRVSVEVNYTEEADSCIHYQEAACADVVIGGRNGERCSPGFGCGAMTCTYEAKASRLRHCASWLHGRCVMAVQALNAMVDATSGIHARQAAPDNGSMSAAGGAPEY